MAFFHWHKVRRNGLPSYMEEVALTIRKIDTDEREVTIGYRTKTDKDGEHWDWLTPKRFTNEPKSNLEVIAWGEKPEPYDPS